LEGWIRGGEIFNASESVGESPLDL